jgi:hypothetical protein
MVLSAEEIFASLERVSGNGHPPGARPTSQRLGEEPDPRE